MCLVINSLTSGKTSLWQGVVKIHGGRRCRIAEPEGKGVNVYTNQTRRRSSHGITTTHDGRQTPFNEEPTHWTRTNPLLVFPGDRTRTD